MQSNCLFLPLVIPVAGKKHDFVGEKVTVPPSVNCFSLGRLPPSLSIQTTEDRIKV